MPTLTPASEPTRRSAAGGDALPAWNSGTLRRQIPAILVALSAGQIDDAANICREPPDPTTDPGLVGSVATDPTHKEQ